MKQMDARYKSRDGDPKPVWRWIWGVDYTRNQRILAFSLPLLAKCITPHLAAGESWKAQIKRALESWGSDYVSLQDPLPLCHRWCLKEGL